METTCNLQRAIKLEEELPPEKGVTDILAVMRDYREFLRHPASIRKPEFVGISVPQRTFRNVLSLIPSPRTGSNPDYYFVRLTLEEYIRVRGSVPRTCHVHLPDLGGIQ